MNGIYEIRYRGATDWGIGLLVFKDGLITGVDMGGVQYDGTYNKGTETLNAKISMTVPPGAQLVQGVPSQPKLYVIQFEAAIPLTSFKDSTPVLVQMPPGPVNVIFKELRSI